MPSRLLDGFEGVQQTDGYADYNKDLDPEEKVAKRQTLSRPVLDDLHTWLRAKSRWVPKDSLTARAIQYTSNQWDLLICYCEDACLQISNAMAENAVQPFAARRRYRRED